MKVIFLDVDGVVNATRPPGLLDLFHDGVDPVLIDEDGWIWKPTDSRRFTPIFTSLELGPWLARLDATVVWATTWCQLDDQLTALTEYLGIPDARVDHALFWNCLDDDESDFDEPNPDSSCGKREAVARWVAENEFERAVWVDDEMTRHDAAWASPFGIACIRTNSRSGLFDVKIRRLIEQHFVSPPVRQCPDG